MEKNEITKKQKLTIQNVCFKTLWTLSDKEGILSRF